MKFVARHDGKDIEVEVERFGTGYRVRIGDRWIEADFVDAGHYVHSLRLQDGTQFSLLHHRDGNEHHITVSGSTFNVEVIDPLSLRRKLREDEMGSGGIVKALMPGRVVRVLVNEGDAVQKGAGLVILEAMKMENEIASPIAGVVDRIFVKPGETVEGGTDVAHIG
ncbi:MAG TPA: biotin/lipoyl-containing protein [Thermoanaerobaculia bacterium]|nr:biotin/lipoyl-containing protein [Thermoanaerobaculia bacterium]